MVIIGAGVVGAAVADELTGLGVTAVTVLDQGPVPVTGGSTSHAPGLVFQTNPAKVMSVLARYTVAKFGALDCFRPVGSLEIATSAPRLAELHRRYRLATSWGVPAELLDPAATVARYDLLDPAVVRGGLYVASDGLAAAVDAVRVQLDRATSRGAVVHGRHPVREIAVRGGAVRAVCTDQGEFPADIVVCAAGIWGPLVGAMVGQPVPLVPLAHQFAWTAPVPGLVPGADRPPRPILRHQDGDLYYRERGDQFGIGYYGHRPMPVAPQDIAAPEQALVMPSLLPFTPDDFAPALAESRRVLPALAGVGVAEGCNGLFSFTTDGLPLIGQSAVAAGFWVAEAVWVTHSAGAGRAVAELLALGRCELADLHGCDLNRFEAHQLAPAYVRARGAQNYVEVYDVVHPMQPMQAPRPMRRSPWYPRQVELDASFLEGGGWERPQWYGANLALVADRPVPTPGPWAGRYWSPAVAAEAVATRTTAGLYDMTSLTRLRITGPGAAGYLQRVTTGNIDRPHGSISYCLLLDDDARLRADITVARLGPDEFQVGVNGPTDTDWLSRRAPDGVLVQDVTGGTAGVGLWGPRARDVLREVADLDLARPYFRCQRGYVGTVPVTALRLSYVGELGWELYCDAAAGATLWDTLWAAGTGYGLVAAGRGAFASLRLEKGYRLFGTDVTFEHDPYEAGLDFAVHWAKGDFTGRAALARRRDAGPPVRRLCCLTFADPADQVMGGEPVYRDGACAGYVTSAAYGYTAGTGVAHAWLPAALAEPGTTVHIGYFDRLVPARVAASPLVDPDMTRLRG